MKNKLLGTAEKVEIKLLIILFYFIVISVLSLATDSFSVSVTPMLYFQALLPYFACESKGRDDDGECQYLLAQVKQQHLYNTSLAYLVTIGFLPFVIFMVISNFKLMYKVSTKHYRKIVTLLRVHFYH